MANTLTAIMPKILARSLLQLRKQAIMPRLVNGSYSREAAMSGSTIDVPIPSDNGAAEDVTPGNTPPSATNSTPTTVQIALDKWKKKGFHLSDKDMLDIDRNRDFVPMQMSQAVSAIADSVNAAIFAEYKKIYGFVGTAGTTPFASTVAGATDLRKTLNQQRAPRADRRAVLNFDAEANALALSQFSDLEKTGDMAVKIDGELGRKYGFQWFSDDDVPTHTAGTGSGYLLNGAASAGATSVTVDTGSGTILVGDIVTFAGHTQTYAVTAALASNVFSVYPALQAAVADNAAVTLKASHVVNLGFHRDAFAFANRPLVGSAVDAELGNRIISMQDPQTGLTMRLEVSRQYKQTQWELDILFGCKLVRPELAVRLAG